MGTPVAQTTTAPDCSTVGYNGDGTTMNPYEVTNVSQLQCMGNQDLTANYTLVSDINATGTSSWNGGAGFEPIGSTTNEFEGTLEGDGRVIDGLFIDRPTQGFVGLVSVNEGVIKNVTLTDADITAKDTVGALVGRSDNAGTAPNVGNPGTIINSSASGVVTGLDFRIGGLVGSTIGTTMQNVSANVTVNADGASSSAGGLVGDSGAYIKNAYATGDVHASGVYLVGGLTGSTSDDKNVEQVYATGNVTGNDTVGGLIGLHNGFFDSTSVVTKAYAVGNVTGNTTVGGLVGSKDAESTVAADTYWNTETTGQGSSDGGTPLSTAEMRGEPAKSNMSFDFTNTWDVLTGDRISYPFLRDNRQEPAPGLMFTVPFFDVEISSTNSPVGEEEILQVTAEVTNMGEPDTQTVSLTDTGFNNTERDNVTVTLVRGESNSSVQLEWTTQSGDSGTGDVTVASENDTDTAPVTVNALPYFDVTIQDTNSPVVEGETLYVNGTVNNTGDLSDTQDVLLTVDGNLTETQSFSLNGGQQDTFNLTWNTNVGDNGTSSVGVSSQNDTDTATVDVLQQSSIAVTIDSASSPVVEGETMYVNGTAENTGQENNVTQTISLTDFNGVERDSTTISLDGGKTTTFSLTWNTNVGDNGSGNVGVSSEDDTATQAVTVNALPYFDVGITGTSSPIQENEVLKVNVTVTNTGDLSDTQTVNLMDFGGVEQDSQTFTLAGGGSNTTTLEWATQTGDSGTGVVTVSSEDTTVTKSISIEELLDRRDVGRGEEDQQRKSQRELGRSESGERDDLRRDSGRNANSNRRDRGR